MNKILRRPVAIILLAGILVTCFSCVRDKIDMAQQDGDIDLHITIKQSEESRLGRAISDRVDRNRIEDMNIVMAKSGMIMDILYISANSSAVAAGDEETTGLVSGSLPAEGGELRYHIAKDRVAGDEIYVVANYRRTTDDEQTSDEGDLSVYFKKGTVTTIKQLKAMRQGTRFVSGIRTSTLFGEAVKVGDDAHGGSSYSVSLERTTAMITVEIREEENEGLKAGVRVIPRQICLHNVPRACHIGMNNAINSAYTAGNVGPNDIPLQEDGLLQSISWGEIRGGDDVITVLGGHGNEEEVLPLFMFENLQGKTEGNSEEVTKDPEKGELNPLFCTYLEIEADYYYIPSDGGNQYAGPIKYRLYLGEDIYNDFNIYRNKHYQVTLTLKGMAGLVEDGQFDKDGKPIAGAEGGASWRIESEVSTAGFIGGTTNVDVSGYEVKIPFVREEGKEYVIYCTENASTSWLMTQCSIDGQPLDGMQSPTKDFPAVPKQDANGQWYIEMFAKAYIHDDWKKLSDIENWDLEKWINEGYREQDLILAEKDGKEVSKITLRQWLPLPVMEPQKDKNGNLIEITKPWDANLYFSRIDVYEGKMLPWGPKVYDDWNNENLITSGDKFGTLAAGGDSQTYSAAFGFHNVVAMYVTDRFGKRYFAYENPQSAMEVAAFRGGNSTGNSTKVNAPYPQMDYYGLPSKEEWDKIKQYGVEDWRFPFSATEYWTSSMDGTKSYTYDYIFGQAELRNRSEKHRVRLVYHKNDRWTAPFSTDYWKN